MVREGAASLGPEVEGPRVGEGGSARMASTTVWGGRQPLPGDRRDLAKIGGGRKLVGPAEEGCARQASAVV